MKSINWKKILRLLPGFIISIIAIFVLSKMTDFTKLVSAFSLLNPLVIVAGVILTILSSMARTQAWRTLLVSRVSFEKSFHILNIGFMLNNLFPLRTGEIGRALLMGKASKLGTFRVLSSIVIERSFDLVMAACFILTTLPFVVNADWARSLAIVVMVAVIFALICLFIIARNISPVSKFINRVGIKNKFLAKYLIPPINSLLLGLEALTSLKLLLLSIFWIILAWGIYLNATYLFLISFIDFHPVWLLIFLSGAVALGIAVPAAPGSIGVYEASFVAVLSLFQIVPSQSLAFALCLHFTNWITMTLLGVYGSMKLGYSFSELSMEIESKNTIVQEENTL
ncbi:MAG: flippase-like domain-containing protein [Leptolinea sp.]|jgi:uncharacterized protein (TIRG00374 family)|nr:flippase-like domain-containing protein [Leptolinea sp.]